MKAFENWYSKFKGELWIPKPVMEAGWRAALEWVLTWENDPESIEVIERELGNKAIL